MGKAHESTALALGRRFQKARETQKLRQADVAESLGGAMGAKIHPSTIAKIEAGDRQVSFIEAIHLCRILSISPEEITTIVGTVHEAADWEAVRKRIELAQASTRAQLREVEEIRSTISALEQRPLSQGATRWVQLCRHVAPKASRSLAASGERLMEAARELSFGTNVFDPRTYLPVPENRRLTIANGMPRVDDSKLIWPGKP